MQVAVPKSGRAIAYEDAELFERQWTAALEAKNREYKQKSEIPRISVVSPCKDWPCELSEDSPIPILLQMLACKIIYSIDLFFNPLQDSSLSSHLLDTKINNPYAASLAH